MLCADTAKVKKEQISWQNLTVTSKKLSHLSSVGEDSIWHRHIELIGDFHALSPLVRQTEHPRIWLHHKSHSLISRENAVPEGKSKSAMLIMLLIVILLRSCWKLQVSTFVDKCWAKKRLRRRQIKDAVKITLILTTETQKQDFLVSNVLF